MDKIAQYWEGRLKQGLKGVGYIGLGEQYNRWLYRVRRHVFLSYAKYISGLNQARILDIGSGTGFYIERWRELGVKSITGIDIAKASVETLTKKYPDHYFLRLDISERLEIITARQFDIVSAFDVLFHIVNDVRFERAIQNIYRQLKPGGIFIF